MIDILSKFSGYVGSKGLPREIENARELRLARKYHELDEHIGKLRGETMKYTFIDPKTGGVKTNDDHRLADLQSQIQAEETRLQRLRVIANEIGTILDEHHVGSVHELHGQREEHESTIQSGPVRAWKQFRIAHELPITSGGHPDLLPSALATVESYKAFEDAEKAKMAAAKTALEPIDEAITRVSSLVAEARTL